MKKILMGFAAATLAAVMCVGFAGCGGGSAADIKGEEVTAEQWAAAFANDSYTNYKVVAKSTNEESEDGKTGEMTQEYTVVVADGKEHIVSKMTAKGDAFTDEQIERYNTEDEFYNEISLLASSHYEKDDDGKWVKKTGVAEMSSQYIIGSVLLYAPFYEAFKYDEEKAGYVIDDSKPLAATVSKQIKNGVLKFKDGKLAGFYMEILDEDDDSDDYSKQVYDIVFTWGGQSVDLPEVEA